MQLKLGVSIQWGSHEGTFSVNLAQETEITPKVSYLAGHTSPEAPYLKCIKAVSVVINREQFKNWKIGLSLKSVTANFYTINGSNNKLNITRSKPVS